MEKAAPLCFVFFNIVLLNKAMSAFSLLFSLFVSVKFTENGKGAFLLNWMTYSLGAKIAGKKSLFICLFTDLARKVPQAFEFWLRSGLLQCFVFFLFHAYLPNSNNSSQCRPAGNEMQRHRVPNDLVREVWLHDGTVLTVQTGGVAQWGHFSWRE